MTFMLLKVVDETGPLPKYSLISGCNRIRVKGDFNSTAGPALIIVHTQAAGMLSDCEDRAYWPLPSSRQAFVRGVWRNSVNIATGSAFPLPQSSMAARQPTQHSSRCPIWTWSDPRPGEGEWLEQEGWQEVCWSHLDSEVSPLSTYPDAATHVSCLVPFFQNSCATFSIGAHFPLCVRSHAVSATRPATTEHFYINTSYQYKTGVTNLFSKMNLLPMSPV